MDGYSVSNISEETIELYKKCFELNGSPKTTEKLQWQFLHTPVDKRYVDIAYSEEKQKTAGIFAVFPVHIKIGDQVFVGAQGLDTMIDIEFRGEGLFILLAKDVYKKCVEDGIKLVYGFPNKDSVKASKMLGWKRLDPVPFMLKPLKTKYFTKKIKYLKALPNINIPYFKWSNKKFRIETSSTFPDDVNTIWQKFSRHVKVGVVRNKKYLEWRYLTKPGEEYCINHIYKDGSYLGFVVYALKAKHQGLIGYIMELMYDTDFPSAGNQLLISAVKDIKAKGADCILSWCMEHSPNRKIFERNLFFNIPEKLKPIKLHFVTRGFDTNMKEIVEDRSNWYLSYSDSDTV